MQSAHQRARHVAGRAPSASPLRPPRAQPCEIARDGREMRGDCRSAPRAPPCVDEARRAPRPSSPPAMVIRGNPRSSEVIRSQLMAIRGHQSSSPVLASCRASVSIAACNQRQSEAIRGNQEQSPAGPPPMSPLPLADAMCAAHALIDEGERMPRHARRTSPSTPPTPGVFHHGAYGAPPALQSARHASPSPPPCVGLERSAQVRCYQRAIRGQSESNQL